MDEKTSRRYRQILRDSLINVATDVPELVSHMGATLSEILVLSDLDGEAIKADIALEPRYRTLQNLGIAYRLSEKALIDLDDGAETEWAAVCAMECQTLVKRAAGWCLGVELGNAKAELSARSFAARKAADALHNKPGGSRSKADAIRAAWATGNFDSRDICAEQECSALGMSFSAARKALRNTPDPA